MTPYSNPGNFFSQFKFKNQRKALTFNITLKIDLSYLWFALKKT